MKGKEMRVDGREDRRGMKRRRGREDDDGKERMGRVGEGGGKRRGRREMRGVEGMAKEIEGRRKGEGNGGGGEAERKNLQNDLNRTQYTSYKEAVRRGRNGLFTPQHVCHNRRWEVFWGQKQ